MSALAAFLLTAPTAFCSGWILRGLIDRLTGGTAMKERTKARVGQWIDWLGNTRKLTVLVVVTAVTVLSSIIYTWSADQQSEDRTDDVLRCIATYASRLSSANLPRTAASVKASDARHDWDMGFSRDEPSLSKSELKIRYDRAYERYIKVRNENPLPELSRSFCEDVNGQ